MTRERIEDMREVVLPFVKKRLLETNYENLGESDAEEFAMEFNEILDLAIKALEQEPKTGRWINNQNGTYTCDKCGCKHSRSNYCPNCGSFNREREDKE